MYMPATSRIVTSPAGIAASALNGAAIDSTGSPSCGVPARRGLDRLALHLVDEVHRGGVLVARVAADMAVRFCADDGVHVRAHRLVVLLDQRHDRGVGVDGVALEHLRVPAPRRASGRRALEVDVDDAEPHAPLDRLGEHHLLAGLVVGDEPLDDLLVRVADEDRVDARHLLGHERRRRSPGRAARRRRTTRCRLLSAPRRRGRRPPSCGSSAPSTTPARRARGTSACPRRSPCPRWRCRGW